MRKIKIVFLSIILVLLIAYIFPIVRYNGDVFLKKTAINNIDVSGLTAEDAQKEILEKSGEDLTIRRRDGKEEKVPIASSDFNIDFGDSITKELSKQNVMMWPAYKIAGHNINIDLHKTYNKESIDKKIAGLNMVVNPTIQDPQDAYIEQTDTGFQIVKEVAGNRVDLGKLKNIVYNNLDENNNVIDLTNEDVYLKPKIKSDSPEILKQLEGYKKFEGLEVTIDFVNASEKLGFQDLKNYISFNENGEIVFNDEKMIEAFTEYSKKYNTFSKIRDFNATGIGTVKVGGTNVDSYGFQLAITKTANAVKDAIKNGQKEVKAVWKIPALVRNDGDDIGNTYVEIDLTRQHLWYYVDGKLTLESDIVSGKDSTPTPVGMNRVWHKERNKTLVGQGYRQPVSYWMPFNWVGCGMHDTNYRSRFGGQIYKRSGSHGCINMPPAKAKALYEMIKLDTPVIVYKS